MIRPASFSDLPRMRTLLLEAYERSIYRTLGKVDLDATKKFLMQAIQHHGGEHAGSSFVVVAEAEGAVEGFLIGYLNRVYFVGDKLMATDTHTIVSARAPARAGVLLFDAFVSWAEANPNVAIIQPGATDAIEHWTGPERLFRSRGFRQHGVIFMRTTHSCLETASTRTREQAA